MPDYLSRSPVDDPADDPDECINTASKATQTDLEFLQISSYTTAAVQTRAAKRPDAIINNTTDNNQTTPDTPNEEHRIIPISFEQLKEAQQNDEYAQNIINKIKKYKQYILKNDLLMR